MRHRVCQFGWTRRRVLSIGATAMGLTLPRLLAGQARAGSLRSGRARAKSVIVLYLSGGPSQLDMWDMKPEAPEEIRGSFRPISTNVPGIQISEHMPQMAKSADKYTIVRSMSHTEGVTIGRAATAWCLPGPASAAAAFTALPINLRPNLKPIQCPRMICSPRSTICLELTIGGPSTTTKAVLI